MIGLGRVGTRRRRRLGVVVRVQRQPIRLLKALITARGQAVSRDALTAALWPEHVHVDFEHGLNTVVRKLRRALGEDADASRFIETVPGQGYRFVAELRPTTEQTNRWLTTYKRLAAAAAAVVLISVARAGRVWTGEQRRGRGRSAARRCRRFH